MDHLGRSVANRELRSGYNFQRVGAERMESVANRELRSGYNILPARPRALPSVANRELRSGYNSCFNMSNY